MISVQLTAYYLWEKAGRPNGNDLHFWFEAEKTIVELAAELDKVPVGDEVIWTLHDYGQIGKYLIVLCDFTPELWEICATNVGVHQIVRGGRPNFRSAYGS
jgi:hypothetical protein